MSTYTALHIRTVQLASVQTDLAIWLKQVNKARSVKQTSSKSLNDLYGKDFQGNDSPPSMIALAAQKSGWVVVHYNSYNEMQNIATRISEKLSCFVVVIMAQSVTETSFVSVHESGQTLRKLLWVGDQGEWMAQEGDPLPFEDSPLGRDIGDEQNPFFIFDRDAVIDYCKHLELQLWNESVEPSSWVVLKASRWL